MTKSLFESYINAGPTTMTEKYVFLIDNQDLVEATIVTGYRALLLIENEELYFNAESFITYLKQIEFSGKYEKDLIYIPACLSKKLNDKLKEHFEKEQFSCHEGWKLFKNCEYLSKSEFQDELKKKLVSFIERFEGSNEIATDLAKFHHHNANGEATGVFDFAIFEHIKANYNVFVCGTTAFIYETGVYSPDYQGTKLKKIIRECLYPQFKKSRIINQIYTLFIEADELQKSFDELNNFPNEYINFLDCMLDARTLQVLGHNPKFFCLNQIPFKYLDIRNATIGKEIEKFFNFIFVNQDDRTMLLEYAGLCMTKDTRQQRFLVLSGLGGTGKSLLIRLIETAVGNRNTVNVGMQELSKRFSTSLLSGALLNSCADLPLGALEDSSTIKKLLGEDLIMAERKGKDAFMFRNYSKLLFSTNMLPTIVSERTNGFFRRLLILKMDRMPEKPDTELFYKLEKEIPYFIGLCVKALNKMYERKIITISKSSEQAVSQMQKDSDVVAAWLSDRCVADKEAKLDRTEAYKDFETYCNDEGRQALSKKGFGEALRAKCFLIVKVHGYYYIKGIKLENDSPNSSSIIPPNEFRNLSKEEITDFPFK